jgi:hypothetical protein
VNEELKFGKIDRRLNSEAAKPPCENADIRDEKGVLRCLMSKDVLQR